MGRKNCAPVVPHCERSRRRRRELQQSALARQGGSVPSLCLPPPPFRLHHMHVARIPPHPAQKEEEEEAHRPAAAAAAHESDLPPSSFPAAAGCVQRACDEVEKEEEEEEEEGRAKEHSLRAVLGPIVAIPSSSSCFSHGVGLQGRSFSAPSLLLRIGQTESEQSVSLYPPRERKTCRSTETEKKEEWENYCWHRRGRETEDERRVSRKVWEMRGCGHWATAKCLR